MDRDREEKVRAETALLFMKDMSKHIHARGPVVTNTMKPIRERGMRNHFFEEAEDWLKRGE